jgi:hypothetical protein
MALSTYSELQAAVLNWMARDSTDTIAAIVPDAIRLAEAKFNRLLRVAEMEANSTGSSTNGVFALPVDFLAARRVEASPYGALEPVLPDWAASAYPTRESGIPAYYTIQGLTLTTYPTYTGDVSVDYYAAIPALSDAEPSNWLLAAYPDLYLFMTLAETCAFTQDVDKGAMWSQRAVLSITEINAQDSLRRFPSARIRTLGPTP